MHALPLLIVAAFTTAAPAPNAGVTRPPENLLAGPARCVLRYLDAVRLAGPRSPDARRGRPPAVSERGYAVARRLTAPRTLEEIERWAARGKDHPLAPWREAGRSRVLDSFQLLAARRAPRGAAIVTVKERYWRADPDAALERAVSEYLVARVRGEWRVVDRRPGGAFDDGALAQAYAGFFDDPAEPLERAAHDVGDAEEAAGGAGRPSRASPPRAPRRAAPARGRRPLRA